MYIINTYNFHDPILQIYSSLVGWDPDPEDVEETVRAFKLVQVSTVCPKSVDNLYTMSVP